VAFTVDDFQDLLRLLDAHPDWRDELRQRLLTPELLRLPLLFAGVDQRLAALTEAQMRTEHSLEALVSRVDTLASQIATLAEAQARTERSLEALISQIDTLTARVDTLTAQVDTLDTRVERLTGLVLEWHHERHVPAFFGRLARHARLVEPSQLADLLDNAVEHGQLPEAERDDVLMADLVVRGRRRTDQADVYFLAEVSAGVGVEDVRRAVDRAAILGRLGVPVVPVVVGEHIIPEAEAYARASGTWQLLDGRLVAPDYP
jgi:polyhydroxyalkanoate synthesis regulator phasin